MTSLPIVHYECEVGCGACCREGIVEIDALDILREPRFKEVVEPCRLHEGFTADEIDEDTGENLGPLLPGWEAGAMIACGRGSPCAMLTVEGTCSVYATRPNVCVAFRAGSHQCQMYRGMAGKEPLRPQVQA